MNEILDRAVNAMDLLYTTPSGHRNDIEYSIAIGDGVAFSSKSGLYKIKSWFKVGNLTEEQATLRNMFIQEYTAYSMSKVKSGGDIKIKPRIGGLYVGESQSVVYLYLGKYKLDKIPFEAYYKKIGKAYKDGADFYLKLSITSRNCAELRNQASCNGSLSECLSYINMNFNWMVNLGCTLTEFKKGLASCEFTVQNALVTTRAKTFKQEIGVIKALSNGIDGYIIKYTGSCWDSNYKMNYIYNHVKDTEARLVAVK